MSAQATHSVELTDDEQRIVNAYRRLRGHFKDDQFPTHFRFEADVEPWAVRARILPRHFEKVE